MARRWLGYGNNEDAVAEQEERLRDHPEEDPGVPFMAGDEPWDVGALHEMQYGQESRRW